MSRIRGSDTEPELWLRRRLWSRGYRYRKHLRTAGGRPDLAFPGQKVAVFIDGCFWHGCPRHYVAPRSSRRFWQEKLRTNVERDQRQTAQLKDEGWAVLRFWEHEVFESPDRVLDRVCRVLRGQAPHQGRRDRVVRVEPVSGDGALERRYLVTLGGKSIGSTVRERCTRKWRRQGAEPA